MGNALNALKHYYCIYKIGEVLKDKYLILKYGGGKPKWCGKI